MRVTSTVSDETHCPPLVIVHAKRLVPMAIPLTAVFANAGLAITPVPLTSVQAPVPTLGLLPERVVFSSQMVWSVPAAAAVGSGIAVACTVADVVHWALSRTTTLYVPF